LTKEEDEHLASIKSFDDDVFMDECRRLNDDSWRNVEYLRV